MLALFALNVFTIIVVVMLVITAIGMISVSQGWIKASTWTHPAVVSALTVFITIILTLAISLAVKRIALNPMKDMLVAMGELKRGNFDVEAHRSANFELREVDEFIDSFNETARVLRSIEILRSDFINDFSHEFKTPIVSINGFAQLLCEPGLTESERLEYAGIIAKESQRLANLSGDILALRQMESLGSIPEEDRHAFEMGEQLRSALVIAAEKWSDKSLSFNVDIEPAEVIGSEALLGRVWTNLVDNACKFSPREGTVTVRAGLMDNGRARATIENDGPELTSDQLERIFDRFYQADPSHATKGCGLGLPLAKRVIELHHGALIVRSERGHTAFTVEL